MLGYPIQLPWCLWPALYQVIEVGKWHPFLQPAAGTKKHLKKSTTFTKWESP